MVVVVARGVLQDRLGKRFPAPPRPPFAGEQLLVGFVDIGPYPESEIPDQYKPHWVFMEKSLA
jgi:hypothetical protein